MKDKSKLILEDPHLTKNILLLALPIMFSNILKSLHDIVDMYFVGHIADDVEKVQAQISAITITSPIMSICQALAGGLMIAGVAIMSQYLGEKKPEKAKRVSGQLLFLCFVLGIFFNALLYFLAPSILSLMGAKPDSYVYQYSVAYVQIRSFEDIGLFVFFAFQASRQASGDTVTPVIYCVFSIVVNIFLTWLFITKFHQDIHGAAWATVIGNLIILPPSVWMLFRKKNNELAITKEDLTIQPKVMKILFKIGIPAALSQALASLGFLLISSLMLGFEDFEINAIGVGNKINGILLYPAMALGTVLATFVGQNIGAGQIERAKKSVKKSLLLSFGITGGGSIILMFFREPFAKIFIENSPKTVELCVYYLFFLLIGLPLMSIFQIFMGCYQGAGRTDFSMILASSRLWIMRIPVIWLFMHVFHLGCASVWYAMTISNFGATILGCILYQKIDFLPHLSSQKKRLEQLKE
jgi:putative MATE family efflux protein